MSTKGTPLSSQLMATEKLVDQLQAENHIMREALKWMSTASWQYCADTYRTRAKEALAALEGENHDKPN